MRRDMQALRTWSIRLAAAAALALAGCGGDDTKTVTAAPGGAGGAGTSQGTTDTGGSGGGSEPADSGVALAKQTVRAMGSKDGTVEIAIRGLKVQGRLLRLTMSFAPKFPSASQDTSISLYDMNGGNSLYVTLVDPINLKRYVVVKDSSGDSLEPPVVYTKAPNGGSLTGTWTFAAPPAGVDKLDVQVGQWPTFNDVKIER